MSQAPQVKEFNNIFFTDKELLYLLKLLDNTKGETAENTELNVNCKVELEFMLEQFNAARV